ncbi:MAG: FmdB family zinc ribbon protein [Nitrospirota bacterium]
MPIYEYECTHCGNRYEVMQKFSDEPLKHCTACGGPLHKLISHTSFVLKGTGWYVTDYASPNRKENSTGEKPVSADAGGKPASPSKTETKPETAAKS